MTLAVLLMAATAFAQDKLLQWDQLMDRNLYPQREAMSFVFAPDGKTVTYYKGGDRLLRLRRQEGVQTY